MGTRVADERSVSDAARNVLLAALVIAIPVPVQFSVAAFEMGTQSLYHRYVIVVVPMDVLLLLLTVLAVPLVVRMVRDHVMSWAAIATTVFALLGLVALLVTPTTLGLSLVLRWIASIAVVITVVTRSRGEMRWLIAAPLLLSGVVQAAIALWQHPGPGRALEFYGGDVVTGRGTFNHPYDLALFLLLAITIGIAAVPTGRTRPLWYVAIGIASSGIAVTMSRTALVSLFLIWGILLWGWAKGSRSCRSSIIATGVPFLVTASVVKSGWLARAVHTATGNIETRSTGRLDAIREAIAISVDQPLHGIGPGQYVPEVVARHPEWASPYLVPVHSVPFLAAAEHGLAAGVLIVAVMVAYGWRAMRTSPSALAVFAPVLAFLLLDHRTYDIPQGVVLFALWLATLDLLARFASE